MNDITFTNLITCSNLDVPVEIFATECIGNSLVKINNNFTAVYDDVIEICESLFNVATSVETTIVLPPIGGIMPYSGKIYDVNNNEITNILTLVANTTAFIQYPNGNLNRNWAVCTGATVNGNVTPNLIGRFVIGSGARSININTFNDTTKVAYSRNETGGEELHHLTLSEVPAHDHGGSAGSYRVVTSVSISPPVISYRSGDGDYKTGWIVGDSAAAADVQKKVNDSLTVNRATISFSVSSQGGDIPHENRPPYYSLYYIMRVA